MTFPEDSPDAVFFVSRGRVKVSYLSEDGKEFTVTILGPGEMYSRHSEGTVTALEDTETWMISMELTHEDIANLIGSSRQTVTSTLRRFERNGLISFNRRHVVIIKDWERLQELAT